MKVIVGDGSRMKVYPVYNTTAMVNDLITLVSLWSLCQGFWDCVPELSKWGRTCSEETMATAK